MISMLMPQRHGVAGAPRLAPTLQRSEMQVKACLFASSSFSSESVPLYISQTTTADLLSCCNKAAVKHSSILLVCRQTNAKSVYSLSAFPRNHLCYWKSHFMTNTMSSSNASTFLNNYFLLESRNSKIHHFKSQDFLSSVYDLMIKTLKETEHPDISSSSKIRSFCTV